MPPDEGGGGLGDVGILLEAVVVEAAVGDEGKGKKGCEEEGRHCGGVDGNGGGEGEGEGDGEGVWMVWCTWGYR